MGDHLVMVLVCGSEASIHYPVPAKPKFSNVCHELNLTTVYLVSCSLTKCAE